LLVGRRYSARTASDAMVLCLNNCANDTTRIVRRVVLVWTVSVSLCCRLCFRPIRSVPASHGV
jgi:hypothetical protein